MKVSFLFFCAVWLCLSACNDDLFVDKLELSATGISVPSDGSTVRVGLSTDDWEIASVSIGNESLYGDVYDLDGKLLSENAPLKGSGLLRMVGRHPLVDFVIERTCADELQLTMKENPCGRAVPMTISVRNPYESCTLDLSVEPSEPYRLDSITYRLDSYGVRENLSYTPANTAVVLENRNSDKLMQWVMYPYKKAPGFVKFAVWGRETLDLFGAEGALVRIPEPGKFLVFLSKETYPLSSEYVSVPIYEKLLAATDTVWVPPFKNMLLESYVEYEAKEFSCSLYVTHPRTGRKRCIDAKCERVDPVDYTLEQTVFAD